MGGGRGATVVGAAEAEAAGLGPLVVCEELAVAVAVAVAAPAPASSC